MDDRLPAQTQERVKELVAALDAVTQTLCTERLRKAYDRKLAEGRAPSLEEAAASGLVFAEKPLSAAGARPSDKQGPSDEMPTQPEPEGGHHGRARRLMAGGNFRPAVALLDSARQASPSDPSVLADLGWARWRSSDGGADAAKQAEEYLQMALMFAPSHPSALEYMARIAMDRGDEDALKMRLKNLVAAVPEAGWALVELNRLSAG